MHLGSKALSLAQPKAIARGKQYSDVHKQTTNKQLLNFTWLRSKDPGNNNPGELQYNNRNKHTNTDNRGQTLTLQQVA